DYNAGVCFDAGHWHAFFDDKLDFMAFEDRIFAVHFHDNDKSDDLHLLPFDGTIDWKKVVTNLKRANYKGAVTLEPTYRYDYLNLELEEFYKKGRDIGMKLAEMVGE
ncbi:MAG: sugar phosphate isomerase/epimerase, partial [Clostridia bacterium]|nr:sugar phosphate isomerase/epimerase [Clostridia bacterium]